jgi:hypothetical protein
MCREPIFRRTGPSEGRRVSDYLTRFNAEWILLK